MSWRDISLTWPCYQTHDGPRSSRVWASLMARAGRVVELCVALDGRFESRTVQLERVRQRQAVYALRATLCHKRSLTGKIDRRTLQPVSKLNG